MRCLLALLLLMAPLPALAQTALMRSGDHAEFTRLTLPLPDGAGFTLTEDRGQATLGFTGPLEAIDLSRVYDRIGRNRLSDIAVEEGPTLQLSLACDCPIETTLAASNLLIIDILDGPALPDNAPDVAENDVDAAPQASPETAFEASLQVGQITARPAPILLRGQVLSLGLPNLDPLRPALPLPRPVAREASAPGSEPPAEPGVPPTPQPATAPALSPGPEDRPAQAEDRIAEVSQVPAVDLAADVTLPPVALPARTPRPQAEELVSVIPGVAALSPAEAQLTRELEQSLLAAIGNAATEGLLTPGAGANPLSEEQRQISEAHSDGTHPDPGLAATPSTFQSDEPDGSGRVVLSGNPCALNMPPLVEVERPDFVTELTEKRARLTGEFDLDDVAAYHDLAHFYLIYGFGPEAGSVLASVQQPPREAAEMGSVARILEYGHDPEQSPFTGRMTCDTDVALWAALAPSRIPPGSDFDGDAIKRALLAMPNTLKAIVGPLLAERFFDAREEDFARDMLRIVDRNVPGLSERQALAAAKLASKDSPPDPDAFHDIIAKNSDVSPEALLHFTNAALDHDQTVDAETIGLLGSYRTQYRETPMAAQFARAEILAHSASGNFPAAFELYDSESANLMPEVREEVVDKLARDLASHGTAPVFTRLYFAHATEIAEKSGGEAMNAVAGRLLNLGLPEVADKVLAAGADGEIGRARRLLRARAALDMNLPRRAEAELSGLEGEDVAALRAEAHLATADYTEAEALFTKAGQAERAATAAWMARNWDSLRSDEEATRARLADVVASHAAQPVEIPLIGPPTLAASREALSQSGETRGALRDLLSTLQVDTALDQ